MCPLFGFPSLADNLQLADKALTQLRAAMEKANLWDSTTILISSDHSLRYTDDADPGGSKSTSFLPAGSEQPLAPFLLKLAGQRTGESYRPPFNAVLTKDLVLSILAGEVSTSSQVAQWLDHNSARVPAGM